MIKNRKKILAISGSTRKESTNQSILKAIARLYSENLEVEMYQQLATLPHFNPDLDGQEVETSIVTLRNAIQQADGVIICTPEYVFSLPGALKNALEWMVSTTVFSDKPVALITASGLGGKAHESLLLIMQTLQAKIGKDSTLLIQGASSKVNKTGDIVDKNTAEEVDLLIYSLLETINESLATDTR